MLSNSPTTTHKVQTHPNYPTMSSSIGNGLAARAASSEGRHFQQLNNEALIKRLETMVTKGTLDRPSVDTLINKLRINTTELITQKAIPIYQHTSSVHPTPRLPTTFSGGMSRVSMGRARWATTDNTSIFSIAEGKKLASTPAEATTRYSQIRAEKIQRAQLATPTLRGVRLLPTFTPGRALLWGSVLAMWGTGALVASAAKQLRIGSLEDTGDVLRETMRPLAEGIRARFVEPYIRVVSDTAGAAGVAGNSARQSQFVENLRNRMMAVKPSPG